MALPFDLGGMGRELLHETLKIKDGAINFKEDLEQLQNTLEQVLPMFDEWMQLDQRQLFLMDQQELNHPKQKKFEDFIEKLQKGRGLIQDCSKVKYNIINRISYSKKIKHLDKAITSFSQMELQVEIWNAKKKLQCSDQQFQLELRKVEGKIEGLIEQQGGAVVGFPVVNKVLFPVPELPPLVVGFDIDLRDLKFELFKEDMTVLGLCAPGGCGKSTLAAMLCHDKEVTGTFKDKIFYITVSKMDSLEILHRLLEAIGGGVPSRSELSEEDATKQFQYFLERKSEPILLVLDEVWEESIIEKLFSKREGYKVLVTSREVFKSYNLPYHSKYVLETLSHQDSVTLLRHTALSHDGKYENYEPDEDHLNEIVRCCGCFPLAITVIGELLSWQPATTWENMARKLSEDSSILDYDEKLHERLSISLDFLDDTVRKCFLDLGSFPEYERIPASALIDIWCELYELEYEDDAYVNLLELASRNLVNLVRSRKSEKENDASLNELFVTQHHLLRDLAIYQSRQQRERLIMYKRGKGLPESWREQEEHYLTARLISLNTGEMCSESWYDLQLPEVEVLILNFSASKYVLPPFMEKMRKLKVLIIVNHGQTHAKVTNLETLGELANLKRIRLEKVSIPSLHEFTMPLKNLQKISLIRCEIGQALTQSTINSYDLLPNLVEINIDYCDDLKGLPPWICDINYLRTLNITNCHNLSALPEGIGYITDLGLLRLHACTGLSKLPDSIQELQKLTLLDISDCSNLEMLPDGMCELPCLKKLDMRGCIKLRDLPPSFKGSDL